MMDIVSVDWQYIHIGVAYNVKDKYVCGDLLWGLARAMRTFVILDADANNITNQISSNS